MRVCVRECVCARERNNYCACVFYMLIDSICSSLADHMYVHTW